MKKQFTKMGSRSPSRARSLIAGSWRPSNHDLPGDFGAFLIAIYLIGHNDLLRPPSGPHLN
jgi:hypothetical protein